MLETKLQYMAELQYWAEGHGKQVTYHVRLEYTPAPLEITERDPKEIGIFLRLFFQDDTNVKNTACMNNPPYSANSARPLTPQEEKKLLTALRGK